MTITVCFVHVNTTDTRLSRETWRATNNIPKVNMSTLPRRRIPLLMLHPLLLLHLRQSHITPLTQLPLHILFPLQLKGRHHIHIHVQQHTNARHRYHIFTQINIPQLDRPRTYTDDHRLDMQRRRHTLQHHHLRKWFWSVSGSRCNRWSCNMPHRTLNTSSSPVSSPGAATCSSDSSLLYWPVSILYSALLSANFSEMITHISNNNNNEKICIAQTLKRTSDALMAH